MDIEQEMAAKTAGSHRCVLAGSLDMRGLQALGFIGFRGWHWCTCVRVACVVGWCVLGGLVGVVVGWVGSGSGGGVRAFAWHAPCVWIRS